MNKPSITQLLNFINSKDNYSSGIFFGQKTKESKWDIDENAIKNLEFNNFDITWAYSPKDSPDLITRFLACDSMNVGKPKPPESINGTFYISTYTKYNYRFEDEYHLLDTIPVDIIKDFGKNKKVLYKYNKEWFRSDNFKKEHDGLHILFDGCSNTEGVGANIEDTWSYLLYSEISKKHKVSGYYNLAKSGAGWHRMIQNFIVYVEKYGAPDYLFVLHPNILRKFVWENEKWKYMQINPWGETIDLDNIISKHREQFPVWVMTWRLFLRYCNSLGTKVLWSTWDPWETTNIENANFFDNTFFPIETINNDIVKKEYINFVMRDDAVWARDGHDGFIQQYHWFKSFLNEINERNFINDKKNN